MDYSHFKAYPLECRKTRIRTYVSNTYKPIISPSRNVASVESSAYIPLINAQSYDIRGFETSFLATILSSVGCSTEKSDPVRT